MLGDVRARPTASPPSTFPDTAPATNRRRDRPTTRSRAWPPRSASFSRSWSLRQPSLVGHSLGGATALQLALDRPKLVRALALVDSAGLGSEISGELLDRVESEPSRDEARRLLELFFEDRRFVLDRGIDDMYAARTAPGADDAVKAIAASAFTRHGQQSGPHRSTRRARGSRAHRLGRARPGDPGAHAVAAVTALPTAWLEIMEGVGPRAAGRSSAGICRDRQSLAGVDPAPVTERTLVGIIANPASGKDIRRLVAHGSTFDNNEKINIVRRVLLGLDAAGVSEVAYLPDTYGIVERAAASGRHRA